MRELRTYESGRLKTLPVPVIGDYEIVSRIGRGGIAEVYKAIQTSLQREVAIKVLSPELTHDSEIVKRFEREAILIAKLNHPNIVHVIDKGVKGSRYYFVMEYVNGADFRLVMNNPRIPIPAKIEMIISVCKALDFAHKNGVIHRDIKPGNILIDRQGNSLVADFGIAQLRDGTDIEVTSSDLIMGTVAYMSPEQKHCSVDVTPATDIFALGVILYEICCGRKPEGRFKMPSEINSNIPRALDKIIMRCLEENPEDRFPTAAALKDVLLNTFSDDISAGPGQKQAKALENADSFMGKCQFLDTIKEDEFGSTYLVQNKENKKLYVIKKKNKGDAGRKEARILSGLEHEHIVKILGAGGDNNKTVIVTDYTQGGSLAGRMGRSYDWREAMEIIGQVAEGLHFAHKNNIIHGNLRPSNILFDENDTVKLTDFGLPGHYVAPKDWYAAPEKNKTTQSDIYSAGALLFQMLTGKTPHHNNQGDPHLHEVDRTVPLDIKKILSRALKLRQDRRYKSLDEFLGDYKSFIEAWQTSPQKEARPKVTPEKRRNLVPYLVLGGVITIGVLLALMWAKVI